MAVKISSVSSGKLTGISATRSVSKSQGVSAAQAVGGVDNVSLTSAVSELQELERRIALMPVVDARLVEEVQKKLANGSFRVDPETTASKLIDHERSLS